MAPKTLREQLNISRSDAMRLGREAVLISERGEYISASGKRVNIQTQVSESIRNTQDIRPTDTLTPTEGIPSSNRSEITVTNRTTLESATDLLQYGHKVLALNFANGLHPGGGFLNGARAQEEYLCRSSALYKTLISSEMYDYHASRPSPDSSDWTIYSPDVPVFRNDDGELLDTPYCVSFLTCAAPYAPSVGFEESASLLRERIYRVIEIAAHLKYRSLVLGAWGCGAFHNDPMATAESFRDAITAFPVGSFDYIDFAITDWSPEERFISPFKTIIHNVEC